MASPTLSLALIAKDEEKNIKRLLDSVEGCFDEIILVDTGSKDRTKEIAESMGCKVFDFEWVNDFSKARNFAFSKATQDYVMWLDLDDVLKNKAAFQAWKRSTMEHAECWLATYNYALDPQGKPVVSFMRERVFKRSINPTWQFPLHEGVVFEAHWKSDYAVSWAVDHLRDAEDLKADKSRNLKILEEMRKTPQGLDSRLQFYYGKELYEQGKPHDALRAFEDAVNLTDLAPHDKMLAFQYGSYSAQSCGDMVRDDMQKEKQEFYDRAISFAMRGLELDPARAEFYVSAADTYIKKQDLRKAKALYAAAKNCTDMSSRGPYAGPIFNFAECYGLKPTIQLAKINFHMGLIDEAEDEANEAIKKWDSEEAKTILKEIERIKPLITIENGQPQTDDIVFTTPPQNAYPFDEEIYKTKGMGGSETALIEMARHLHKKTGRTVRVFNQRDSELVAESGVIYTPNTKANEWLSKNKPKAHFAWRHNIKMTSAPTYLWCHDLMTPTVEMVQNFDNILCLSPFHKDYVMGRQGVPADKIHVTRNGINSDKFKIERKEKNPNKLVWMSSPDRGLDTAMLVCDEVRKTHPDVELHVYYGLDNLYKYNMAQLGDHLKAMMSERPWVKYHGNTEQSKMYQEVSDAVVWCHPCNFIETFCITALEMLSLGVYPVTRRLGALQNTLSSAEEMGMATLLDQDPKLDILPYVNAVNSVLAEKKWENISINPEEYDWSVVADEWIREFNL